MAAKRMETSAETTITDLPSDPLLLILAGLPPSDLQSVSLVSKSFLSLSNRFIRKLTFRSLPSDCSFRKIFTRFSCVKEVAIDSTRIGRALTAISSSALNLESLQISGFPSYPKQHHLLRLSGKFEKLKALSLWWFSKVGVDQIVEFIQLFPALEELDFKGSGEWNDVGIEKLSSKVPNLRKIDLSGNKKLTDRALDALSKNCVNLEDVCLEDHTELTPQGLCAFLRKRPNLKSIVLPNFVVLSPSELLPVAEGLSNCKNLSHFSFGRTMAKDDFLCTIAKSRSTLKTLKILCRQDQDPAYTIPGLSATLVAFQGLERLEVCLPHPSRNSCTDVKMSQLVKCLPCLKDIFVQSCYYTLYKTLFSLIENCPLLESICLHCLEISHNDRSDRHAPPSLTRRNYSIKCISLLPRPDEALKIVLKSFCPSVKRWNAVRSGLTLPY
uniref:F-box domain-containing protein n=1 Tax=Kalanchoe fedtschenkoi TaxID=63787 RepID=A0A7N0V4W6_KALFE